MPPVVASVVGHFWPDLGVRLQPLGDAFIKAIKVMIAPIISSAVVAWRSPHGRHGARRPCRAEGARLFRDRDDDRSSSSRSSGQRAAGRGTGMNIDVSPVDTLPLVGELASRRARDRTFHLPDADHLNTFRRRLHRRQRAAGPVRRRALASLAQLGDRRRRHQPDRPGGADAVSHCRLHHVAALGALGASAFTVGRSGPARSCRSASCCLNSTPSSVWSSSSSAGPIARFAGFSLLEADHLHPRGIATLSSWRRPRPRQSLPRSSEMEAGRLRENVVGLVIPDQLFLQPDGTCLYLATATVFLAPGDQYAASAWQADPPAC